MIRGMKTALQKFKRENSAIKWCTSLPPEEVELKGIKFKLNGCPIKGEKIVVSTYRTTDLEEPLFLDIVVSRTGCRYRNGTDGTRIY